MAGGRRTVGVGYWVARGWAVALCSLGGTSGGVCCCGCGYSWCWLVVVVPVVAVVVVRGSGRRWLLLAAAVGGMRWAVDSGVIGDGSRVSRGFRKCLVVLSVAMARHVSFRTSM